MLATITSTICLIYSVILMTMIMYSLANHLNMKMRNLPPSPFPALPVIGHLYLFKKPLHRALANLSHSHGPVLLLRLGSRRALVVTSPSAAEECLTQNDVAFANRPRLLQGKHLGYNYTTITWAPYGDHWRNLRRMSSLEILSTHRLNALAHIRADESRHLLLRLFRHVGSDTPVDMKSAFFELTMNVMMRMIAGTRYYGVSSKAEEAEEFRDIVKESFRLGVSDVGDFLPFVKWFGTGRGKERSLSALHKRRDRFMQNLIEEHRRNNNNNNNNSSSKHNNKTMIEVLLALQDSDPEYYKDENIRGMIVALLVAGTDTSAGTMEWALSALLNNPQVMKKAYSEIQRVVGNNRLMEESDLSNLPYLHTIVRETLRLYPPGPLSVPHESSQDCKVSGYHVPRGTILLVNLWAIQQDAKIWEDPTEFRPERFEESGDVVRDGFKMMPFGAGRRSCPGENLGLRLVGLNLGLLIQCFQWDRPGKELVDMNEGLGITMPKGQPLLANCKPRPSMLNILSQI